MNDARRDATIRDVAEPTSDLTELEREFLEQLRMFLEDEGEQDQ